MEARSSPRINQLVGIGSANQGYVDEIENPNPAPDTNNWYAQDGYGGGSYGSPSYGGGSYSNCSDSTRTGRGAGSELSSSAAILIPVRIASRDTSIC